MDMPGNKKWRYKKDKNEKKMKVHRHIFSETERRGTTCYIQEKKGKMAVRGC